jgi:hypothetical protein
MTKRKRPVASAESIDHVFLNDLERIPDPGAIHDLTERLLKVRHLVKALLAEQRQPGNAGVLHEGSQGIALCR